MAHNTNSDNFSLYRQFWDHIAQRLCDGITCEGQGAQYVPFSSLLEHWTTRRIRVILRTVNLFTPVNVIKSEYLRVFSILVEASSDYPSVLSHLEPLISCGNDDHSLPWITIPRGLKNVPNGQRVFEIIFDRQWKFCPALLPMNNRELNRLHILPFTFNELDGTTEGRDSRLQRVTVNSKAHANLGKSSIVAPPQAHLKTYLPGKEEVYRAERKAYDALGTKSNNIVKCWGTFYWVSSDGHQFSTLILEHAEHGSLAELFAGKISSPPYKLQEIQAFWLAICDLVKSLEIIHNQPRETGFSGVHQDLRPSNILVFAPESPGTGYMHLFKIGDFGESHVAFADGAPGGQHGQNNKAARTYGPPENFLDDSVSYQVGPPLDMWAIGCIILEAAVWVSFGPQGLVEFESLRKAETGRMVNHRSRGRLDCFHNSMDKLACVNDLPRWIDQEGRKGDFITNKIVEIILRHALVPKNRRLNAEQLFATLTLLFEGKEDQADYGIATSSSGIDRSRSPGHQQFSAGLLPARLSQVPSPEIAHCPQLGQDYSELQRFAANQSQQSYHESATATDGSSRVNGLYGRRNESQLQSESGPAQSEPTVPTMSAILERPALPPQPKTTNAVDGSQDEAGPSMPSHTPELGSRSHSVPKDNTDISRAYPKVLIGDLEQWIQSKKKGYDKGLKGWDTASLQLKERDFILVIDNSRTMQAHEERVVQAVYCLGYLIKELDPDGVQIMCTSNPSKILTFKKANEAKNFVSKNFSQGRQNPCNIEDALGRVLNPVKQGLVGQAQNRRNTLTFISMNKPMNRPTSVLIFTDGVWDANWPEGVCGADGPIESLIKVMKDHLIDRPHVSLQFVRFGTSPVGIERLRILDDELPLKEQNKDYDIIDSKPISASVWDILIGPILKGND